MLAGFSLGLVSSLTFLVGGLLVRRVVEGENRAYVQQSIGDATQTLASLFRAQFEHIIEHMNAVGTDQLQRVNPSAVDVDSDFIDFSIWERQQASSAFDLNPAPKRVNTILNSKFQNASQERAENWTRQLEKVEEYEKNEITAAFQGHTIIFLEHEMNGVLEKGQSVALIAIPVGQGLIQQVISSHIKLSSLQDAFHRGEMVHAMLVDHLGNILVQTDPDSDRAKSNLKGTPFFQAASSSTLVSNQGFFSDEKGNSFLGGFSHIGIGKVIVMASVSEAEERATLGQLTKLSFLLGFGSLIFFIGVAYLFSDETRFKFWKKLAAFISKDILVEDEMKFVEPQLKNITVLYGSIRHLIPLVENGDPRDSADALNDFFTLASSAVREYGGVFERQASGAFIGFWGAAQTDGTEVWCALRSALEFRKAFSHLNESRKVDGRKRLSFGLGIHTGRGLAARLGAAHQMKYTVVGEVIQCAKALNRLTASFQVDLLVSQDSWQLSEAKFVGESVGEARLTAHTGLMDVFRLEGYRDEQGRAISIDTPVIEEVADVSIPNFVLPGEKSKRWLVNNGSQMIGPLSPHEIATRLFAQELDFDCECWAEGTGTSAQIRNAGIFSGSDDAKATLWLFDGETIHGPVSHGFLKTALGHGALSSKEYVCENSTINGWKPIAEWNPSLNESSQNQSITEKSLESSLAPPTPLLRRSSRQSKELDTRPPQDPKKKAA